MQYQITKHLNCFRKVQGVKQRGNFRTVPVISDRHTPIPNPTNARIRFKIWRPRCSANAFGIRVFSNRMSAAPNGKSNTKVTPIITPNHRKPTCEKNNRLK